MEITAGGRLHGKFTPTSSWLHVCILGWQAMLSANHLLKALLAGDERILAEWIAQATLRRIIWLGGVTFLTCALYGSTFGLWRSELQSFYTALKFPVVVLLTCAANALLNGSLAHALGLGLGFRQSTLIILMSFTSMGLLLAAFAPVLQFVWWNLPAPDDPLALTGKNITLLTHVVAIALAGIVANRRLWLLIFHLTGSRPKATLILWIWLGSNLLLGSQISWILRPWIGSTVSPLTFFSTEPLRGNFFEAVWESLLQLLR